MKLKIPYPLLLVTAIILDRVTISSAQIQIGQSLRSLAILLGLISIAIYILQYYYQVDWHYTNYIVLMIPLTYLVYRSLYRFLKINFSSACPYLGLMLVFLFGVLYAGLVHRKTWRFIGNPVRITAYFSFVFSILLMLQIVRLAQSHYSLPISTKHAQRNAISAPDFEIRLYKNSPPDIYVIVLDSYARQDVLEVIYQYDNSEFTDWLQERGFYVATENHSNYVQTPYSMASFWNFDYLPTWELAQEYDQYLYQPIQSNRVFHLLDEIGYTTISMKGSIHYAEIRNADMYLSSFLPLNDFETLLLVDSPFEPLSNIFDLRLPLHTYKVHRQQIYDQLELLKEIPAVVQSPKIVYTHILSPHPPFVFDQEGKVNEIDRPFTLAEGAAIQGGSSAYVNGYREQVHYISTEIMKVIDVILNMSKIPPIIVVMGDHGPASQFNFDMNNPGCTWERTSNLYAVLLPGHKYNGILYPSISPVNTFRIIFNTYFDTHLPILEDKSYLRSWQQPAWNVDITSERDSLHGCDISAEPFHGD
ncbi:MAG TPA: hypothetical protein VK888_07625 [Anaerolineales bacterium]|nr:hypothetical protein [Anaerolineales bacterium]